MKIIRHTCSALLLAITAAALIPPSVTAAPVEAAAAKPRTPKIGSPERKAIFDAIRREVAADQQREDPQPTYAPTVFTATHFKVLGSWAFVDASMEPGYAEGSVVAVLKLLNQRWEIKLLSFADDVPDYDKFAKKSGAPRALFPTLGKLPK